MTDDSDPAFSDDFAARVFGEAERVGARRLRERRVAALAAVAAAGFAFLFWVVVPAGVPQTRSVADVPSFVPRLVDLQPLPASAQTDEPGALGYLFPDAEPVARFAAEYSDTDDEGADTDLFADEDSGTP